MVPSYRVLLIEDDEDDYFLIKDLLSRISVSRFIIQWADTYASGYEAIRTNTHDVVLLDYRLGERNGLDLLREAIKVGCEAPIILLTGQGNEIVDFEAMQAGAADYLVKEQISRELLERAIRYSIAHKRTEISLIKKTAELASANEALILDDMRLQALWELSQMSSSPEEEIAAFVLDRQIRITGSQFGMFGFVDETESALMVHAWSRRVLRDCIFQATPWPIEEAGIWAEAALNRKPLIINDYESSGPALKGCPFDHIPVFRVMSVPLLVGDRIVAVSTVANKETGYNESDVRQASLLLDGMWRHIERERAERALRNSESLAAMGRALSSVAHDIKTPLIAIGGFARMVHRNLHKASKDRERLDIVLKETARLEKMLHEMLDFSRPLELEKSPENPCKLVKETLSIVSSAAEERQVYLDANLRQCDTSVSLDATRMKQVLINLVMNAIQASPKGEVVKVSVHLHKRGTIFDVADCGCGIPFEKRSEIFSPFFTTKKEGTGLGLPIVKKIIDAHKGHLEILDNPESGVTFRVVLPMAA